MSNLLPLSGPPEANANSADTVYLRIPCASIRLHLQSDAVVSGESLCLLSGLLDDFLLYAGQEASQWLIDQAHAICDPALLRGSLWVWKEQQHKWGLVAGSDALESSTYFYILPDETTTPLSRISEREGKSKTAASGDAAVMRERVLARDGCCWVTGSFEPVCNSHICPKRMGDDVARAIFETFTGQPRPGLSVVDPVFGVCLSLNMDSWFDNYIMGFRYVSPDTYETHIFDNQPQSFTVGGRFRGATTHERIHHHLARPPVPDHASNPPPGLFRWHYMQCVVHRFGDDEYKSLANIRFANERYRMEGDSDNEDNETDDDAEWPSKMFDVGQAVEAEETEAKDRLDAVNKWLSS